MRLGRCGAVWLLLTGLSARVSFGQATGGWVVRPEWVRAHEEFLASDVMAGRGSATRDEELAATYVASQFLGYGLKPAPGLSGYLQSAEVVVPDLDGHAVLRVGGLMAEEGVELQVLSSTGESVKGPLVKVNAQKGLPEHVQRGSVIALQGVADGGLRSALSQMRRMGAAVVVLERGPATETMFTMSGGKIRTPIRLKGDKPKRGMSILAASAGTFAALGQQPDAVQAVLEVQQRMMGGERRTFNAIGYLAGSDPASGTLLLTAHLDHLGLGRAVNGDAIFNGANDDASGTTAVLELAHALAAGPQLRRSVLFVCYGGEEAGELGSSYFSRHSPVPLKDLVLNLEFEMIGTQDPKLAADTLMLTGWERSNLGAVLREHGARLAPDPYPEQEYFQRSDNYQLALKGVVAHTASGWGATPTYHQPTDDLAHLDLGLMTTVIQSLVEPVRWLAEGDFRPEWTKNGRPTP